MNKDILPCPFCGAAAKVKGYEPTDSFILKYDVVCCKNEQHILELCMDDPQEAIDVWNERAWLGESEVVEQLRERIAELETAHQWHDASEPPENMQGVQIKTDGHIMNGIYVHSVVGYAVTFCDQRYIIARIAVDGWRDLPPMPEVDT